MNYFTLGVGFLLIYAVCLVATVLGRGWFLWPADEPEGHPRQ
jgi:hypothetical protein